MDTNTPYQHQYNPHDIISRLREGQGMKCFYCDSYLALTSYSNNKKHGYTRDHFFSLAKSRRTTRGNLVLSCYKCNQSKGCNAPSLGMCHRFYQLWEKIGETSYLCDGWKDFMDTQRYIDWLNYLVGPIGGVVIESAICYNAIQQLPYNAIQQLHKET